MHVAVVTPAASFVTLAQAKAHLQVEHNADNDLIQTYVTAAIEHLDGPEGYLRRALGVQVLKATVYDFPGRQTQGLSLPYPPVSAINDVEYVDVSGVKVDLDPDVYELTPEGRFRLAWGMAWPSRRSVADPISITFTAGYPTVPRTVVTAVLMHLTAMYDGRNAEADFPDAARRLVSPLRIRRL